MPSVRGPRWCWSATTASSPPSPPAAASAPSASAWAPSELTVNRRQVEAWEQRAIDDVRAGNLEQAIAAYAEHDRIRAFEARDDRDRALVSDWWQAHQAGEQPVIYAHRRAQVDQLNACASGCGPRHGQLGPERLRRRGSELRGGGCGGAGRERPGPPGRGQRHHRGHPGAGRARAGDDGADAGGGAAADGAAARLVPGRRRCVPGQSRRVDLAYARTDMRSQGRTERRALLALDGAEDMQGGYVQLTRSTQRTDLYLTVGPEPLGPDEERPHPTREARAPEELLARVLTRDGSKTLATDTPDLLDVRRLSTRQLRAERDRLAQLRAAVSAGPLPGAAAGHPAGGRGRAGPPAGPHRPPGRRASRSRRLAGSWRRPAGARWRQGAAGAGRATR